MNDLGKNYINRLTALWALSESGLGGMMHALKIPFTGFFLGGFAIVIITLIAANSTNRFRDILQATLLVVLVKATASPHSPPMAYIALGFQGIVGALAYQFGFNRIAALLFGTIALFESAIQKFLTATLIFGKSIWEALDAFFLSITKDLGMSETFSFSLFIIVAYTSVYTIWGALLGAWAFSLPRKISQQAETIVAKVNQAGHRAYDGEQPALKKNKKLRWLSLFFILIFIVTVFVFQKNSKDAAYAIMRTVAALLLLFYIVGPLFKYLLFAWIRKHKAERQHKIKGILDALPELTQLLQPAMQLARKEKKGLWVYPAFVFNLIVLSLYYHSTADAH